MQMRMLLPVLVGFLTGVLPSPLSAQSGTVKADGQPIPGASVRATQGERSLVTLADANGAFQLTGATPGTWGDFVPDFGPGGFPPGGFGAGGFGVLQGPGDPNAPVPQAGPSGPGGPGGPGGGRGGPGGGGGGFARGPGGGFAGGPGGFAGP